MQNKSEGIWLNHSSFSATPQSGMKPPCIAHMEVGEGAETNTKRSKFQINPFKGEVGKCLPTRHHRCASGYLLRPNLTMRSLVLCVLQAEIQFLSHHC